MQALKLLLLAALPLVTLPRPAAAVQLEGDAAEVARREHRALVAERLLGSWQLDRALLQRIAPSPRHHGAQSLKFVWNPGVLLAAPLPKGRPDAEVFGGGLVSIDGDVRPYLLADTGKEFRLLVFVPSESGEYVMIEDVALHMDVRREVLEDRLYFGGEGPRSAQSVYRRASGPLAAQP